MFVYCTCVYIFGSSLPFLGTFAIPQYTSAWAEPITMSFHFAQCEETLSLKLSLLHLAGERGALGAGACKFEWFEGDAGIDDSGGHSQPLKTVTRVIRDTECGAALKIAPDHRRHRLKRSQNRKRAQTPCAMRGPE